MEIDLENSLEKKKEELMELEWALGLVTWRGPERE